MPAYYIVGLLLLATAAFVAAAPAVPFPHTRNLQPHIERARTALFLTEHSERRTTNTIGDHFPPPTWCVGAATTWGPPRHRPRVGGARLQKIGEPYI